jgi:hypothetical protein
MPKTYTFEELYNKINKMETELHKLKGILIEICPHKDVIYNSWCEDDYAQHKTYAESYCCKDCRLYASTYSENQAIFKMLKHSYNQNKKNVIETTFCVNR